jgi:hypothetical protein
LAVIILLQSHGSTGGRRKEKMNTKTRFVPLGEAQDWLKHNYGLKKYTDRHQRELIKQGRFPQPVEISPSRKAFTEDQLHSYAQGYAAQTEIVSA